MEKINYKRELILWILVLIPFAYIGYIWPALPDRIPIHFDIHGMANDWGGREMIFLLPAIHAVVYVLFLFLPKIDPKKMSEEFFQTNFYKVRVVVSIFLFALSLLIAHLSLANGTGMLTARLLPIASLALITMLGNFMINMKPNWFIGIRTPWTLSSDYVWKQTHRLFGRIWFYGGLICLLVSLVVSVEWIGGIILIFVVGSTLFSLAYSYIIYRQEQKGNAT
jgi:uncharacterized membrane protein